MATAWVCLQFQPPRDPPIISNVPGNIWSPISQSTPDLLSVFSCPGCLRKNPSGPPDGGNNGRGEEGSFVNSYRRTSSFIRRVSQALSQRQLEVSGERPCEFPIHGSDDSRSNLVDRDVPGGRARYREAQNRWFPRHSWPMPSIAIIHSPGAE